jgi:aspartate aminotransferase
VLNNPHNPTGALYTDDELKEIADVCRKHNTFVLADEIYALTTYHFERFTSMRRIYPEGTFVTNGLSKDRSSGGYRLGSCNLPEDCSEDLKEDFRKVAATMYTNVSTPTQYAAITAYEPNEEIEEYFTVTREIHRIMGQYMSAEFNTIEGIKATIPEGTFYFFADFNELTEDLRRNGVSTSNELERSLIAHPHHIATVTGDACMLRADDYGARIAFVDYDGKQAYENFRESHSKTRSDEREFVKQNATRMVNGIGALRKYVAFIKRE